MHFVVILLSTYLMISNVHVDAKCSDEICIEGCKHIGLNGTSNDMDYCKCSLDHPCSNSADNCDEACKWFGMDGECGENDQCLCMATFDWCDPEGCGDSCEYKRIGSNATANCASYAGRYISTFVFITISAILVNALINQRIR